MLDKNWQRLILTHLEEKRFRGILTGSEITDMKITLIAGRAHLKHTEGGDFRQATYRAVRQGLCEAGCVLLEPYYAFRLEVPSENLGRAMADLDRMQGEFSAPEQDGAMALLTGTAPVSTMRNYQRDVMSYTKGRGRLTLSLSGMNRATTRRKSSLLPDMISILTFRTRQDLFSAPTAPALSFRGTK